MIKDDPCISGDISTNKTEPMHLVRVASFPSSGNMRLAHMTKGVFGIFTDSIKEPTSGTKSNGKYGY